MFLLGILFIIAAVSVVSGVLAASLLVLVVLSGFTLLALWKFRVLSARVLIIFSLVLFVHLGVTLIVHYANFYPFGGGEGDQWWYHKAAVEISDDFQKGNFSLQNMRTRLDENGSASSYPVLLSVLYTVTVPDKLVGKMLGVWLVGLSAVLLYALSRELGVPKKFGFLVGISPVFYPSYLYWGGFILRESMVISLVLLSTLLILRMQKRFSFTLFIPFYIALGALIHFRFYPGFVILFLFPVFFIFLFSLEWRKKLAYGLLIIPLLGFLPQIEGRGYYGTSDILHFTNPTLVTIYRENIPGARLKEIKEAQKVGETTPPAAPISEKASKNLGSTVIVETGDTPFMFAKNYITSFFYMLLGPFPWHIRYARQLFVLVETIPWWIAFFFVVKGVIRSRRQWKAMAPIILISMGILAEVALILNTYGTYMRIRMPAFLLLFTLIPLAFLQMQESHKEDTNETEAT